MLNDNYITPDALDRAQRLSALRVVSGRSDGAPVRLVDDRTGHATELAPDRAGRATRFGAHDLSRDRKERVAVTDAEARAAASRRPPSAPGATDRALPSGSATKGVKP